MTKRNRTGIEIVAPAGALSPEALGLLQKHKPMIEIALMFIARAWLRIGELGEHGELQILLGGRVEEAYTANLLPTRRPVKDWNGVLSNLSMVLGGGEY